MEEIFLDAQPRKELGKGPVKDLREKGFIPAVVYGAGKGSLPVKISHRQLMQLVHQHRIENAVINLKMEGDKKRPRPCLIKEIQYEPVVGNIVHVDFNEISLTKAIKVNVPVVARGEPIGVKQEGGSLEHILWEIEVECLPTDIPKEIEVDITHLKVGESMHLKEVTFPPKLKVLTDSEAIVFCVVQPLKEEVVAAPVEGEEKQEPEVIKEKKEVAAEGSEEKEEGKEKKEKK